MAVSAVSNVAAWSFHLSEIANRRNRLSIISNPVYQNPIRFSLTMTPPARSFVVRALDRQRKGNEADENSRNSTGNFLPPEDWGYLAKLLAGSVVGAAAIKYGSVIFPVITRPNLVQALIMILTPVIVSVFLLIKQSSLDKQD